MLPRQAMAAEKAVVKSSPSSASATVATAKSVT